MTSTDVGRPPFFVEKTPCGRPVYVTEYTDWKGMGFPHPITGVSVFPGELTLQRVDEQDPANKYGVMYHVGKLSDGTFVRILND